MTYTQRRRLIMLFVGVALCAGAIWYGFHAGDPKRRQYDGPLIPKPHGE